ncbi:MAG: glycosyltransferase family 2 protein [Patescibacteria group bacterium]|nr:glycosyltransferase family 2 protein [Patescibacteria group bacterium]
MVNLKVSIIIPTYNRAHVLPRAISSALTQTVQDFEIIVSDDGSTDNTKEIVKAYQSQDARIQYLYQEHSGGAALPKNAGIQQAKGEYIAVLDSDDEWMPEKLETQLKLFKDSINPKLGFVGCDAWFVDSTNTQIYYKIPEYSNVFSNILIRDYMGPGSCIMYKKKVFDDVGLFDTNLKSSQDREMRIRLAQTYDFAVVHEALVVYHIGNDNITSALQLEKREKDWDYIFKKHKQWYTGNSRIYSAKLRYDGTQYMLFGDTGKARKAFLRSLRVNPFNIKSILYLLLSILGVGLYGNIARGKMRMKGLFNQ